MSKIGELKDRHIGFNPHPARRLDAILGAFQEGGFVMFQSSSSPKAGCYLECHVVGYGAHVSILIQPEGWMLLSHIFARRKPCAVSILIQPEGWMLLETDAEGVTYL